jgi:hypothetical protein
MASLVNPFNINGNYPVAGQDNDSQGFRDNFTNIKNNFFFIKQEVEDLQSKAILKSALQGTTLDNNFLGSQVKNIQVKNISETVYDWGEVGAATATEVQLDLALGNVHKLNAVGSIKINSVIKNWPSSLQYSRLLFYVNIDSPTHTLELPSTLTTDLNSIPGLRTVASSKLITFTDPGDYIFEFSSVDSGTTIFVRELTKGNPVFRDPNFYMAGIGTYSPPSLRLGWGNLFGISSTIDSVKGNTDVFSVRGAITSYVNMADGGNNPANNTQAGFSVAKSRAADPGASGTLVDTVVNSNDYIGYFNGLALTKNRNDSLNSYQAMASIGMYAVGANTSYGIGGNVVISTKRDGGVLSPAITIDNEQNVVIFGGLNVQGNITYIESTTVVTKDKQLMLANGALAADSADTAGVSIETGGGTYANIAYRGPTATNITNGVFDFNRGVNVSVSTTSTGSTTGALIVSGGVGIGGNLNVGGVFGLTATTEATSTTSAAFAVGGGIATTKNLIVGGNLFANSTTTSIDTLTGALQVQGGGFLKGNLIIGGDSSAGSRTAGHGGAYILSTTSATDSSTGALNVAGGVGIRGNLHVGTAGTANGVVIASTLGVQPAMFGSNATARIAAAALRVRGGSAFEGNVVVGFNNALPGRLFIDNGQNPSVFANGIINYTSGGMVLGNGTSLVGATITGDMFIGTDNSGSIYTVNKEKALGGPIDGILKPFETELTGGQPTLGAITALGGANIFGDLFVGQPHDGTDYDNSTGGWTGSVNPATNAPYGAYSGNLNAHSGAPATSFNTGAVVIANVKLANGSYSQGGMGIAGNLYVDGNVVLGSIGRTISNVVIASETVSSSSTTGALVVVGGAGIAGALNVAGKIDTTNTTESTSSSTGSLIADGGAYIAKRLNVAGNIVAVATTAATSTTTGSFVARGGVGIAGATYIGGVTIGTGNIVAAATTTTTDINSGSIVAKGGIGAAGVIIAGGNIVAAATTTTTDINSGSFVAKGGVGVAGVGIFGGNLVAAATTASTNTTTGALVVGGGAGVAGAIIAGGNIVAASATASTNTTTGALVVTGGVGIAGATFTGGNISTSGAVFATGASSVIGYAAGAGGTVTQGTSRTTPVTLNKATGSITLFTAAGATAATTFTVNNNLVGINDTIVLNQKSGSNLYVLLVTAVTAGTFNITFYTTGGTASDAPVINFNVIKGAGA